MSRNKNKENLSKILIIEDDASIAEIERDYLEANGYDVVIASDGMAGLNMAADESVSLVLLDIMLPSLNGFNLCRALREKRDIPILIVSAKTEEIDKVRGLGLGADDYIVKPFLPNEMIARVKSHLARYRRLKSDDKAVAEASDIIECGGLVINKAARRVLVDGGEVELTHLEFDLLYFLAVNRGHVFSREVLLDRVWKMDNFSEPSTVTVHIKRLRKKIEADPANPRYIETVWGTGYRFRE